MRLPYDLALGSDDLAKAVEFYLNAEVYKTPVKVERVEPAGFKPDYGGWTGFTVKIAGVPDAAPAVAAQPEPSS